MISRSLVLAAILALLAAMPVFAAPMEESRRLAADVQNSTVILVGKLTNFTEKTYVSQENANKPMFISGLHAIPVSAQAGHYDFTVVQTLSGKASDTISLELPAVRLHSYGGAEIYPTVGKLYIVMLSTGGHGQLVATDANLPILPIEMPSNPQKMHNVSLLTTVLATMLQSLDNHEVRKSNLYIVRDTKNAIIPEYAIQYCKDGDTNIADSALYCMLNNGHIEVIPLISQLENKLYPKEETTGSSAASLTPLVEIEDTKAVPYINPLLDSPSPCARLDAMIALDRLADATSIPYLIRALEKPDPQHYVQYRAYRSLYRLIPSLGAPMSDLDFQKNRNGEIDKIKSWYSAHHERS